MNKGIAGPWLSLLVLAGCGGGGDGVARQPEPVDPVCDSTSVPENGTCRAFAERIDARATTPFTEDGEPVELEVVLFRPLEGGRFPLLVVNHGSTGNGSDPSLFDDTFIHKPTSLHFVEQGWMVAYPQRRGRGRSDGLYDEGCGDFAAVNRSLFVDGAVFPARSLWIYAENDSFYSLEHSRVNFDAFTGAGGVGDFEVFRRDPGFNGHFIINDVERWSAAADAYKSGL